MIHSTSTSRKNKKKTNKKEWEFQTQNKYGTTVLNWISGPTHNTKNASSPPPPPPTKCNVSSVSSSPSVSAASVPHQPPKTKENNETTDHLYCYDPYRNDQWVEWNDMYHNLVAKNNNKKKNNKNIIDGFVVVEEDDDKEEDATRRYHQTHHHKDISTVDVIRMISAVVANPQRKKQFIQDSIHQLFQRLSSTTTTTTTTTTTRRSDDDGFTSEPSQNINDDNNNKEEEDDDDDDDDHPSDDMEDDNYTNNSKDDDDDDDVGDKNNNETVYSPHLPIQVLNNVLEKVHPGMSISLMASRKNDDENENDDDTSSTTTPSSTSSPPNNNNTIMDPDWILVEGMMNCNFQGDTNFHHPSVESYLKEPGFLDCHPRIGQQQQQQHPYHHHHHHHRHGHGLRRDYNYNCCNNYNYNNKMNKEATTTTTTKNTAHDLFLINPNTGIFYTYHGPYWKKNNHPQQQQQQQQQRIIPEIVSPLVPYPTNWLLHPTSMLKTKQQQIEYENLLLMMMMMNDDEDYNDDDGNDDDHHHHHYSNKNRQQQQQQQRRLGEFWSTIPFVQTIGGKRTILQKIHRIWGIHSTTTATTTPKTTTTTTNTNNNNIKILSAIHIDDSQGPLIAPDFYLYDKNKQQQQNVGGSNSSVLLPPPTRDDKHYYHHHHHGKKQTYHGGTTHPWPHPNNNPQSLFDSPPCRSSCTLPHDSKDRIQRGIHRGGYHTFYKPKTPLSHDSKDRIQRGIHRGGYHTFYKPTTPLDHRPRPSCKRSFVVATSSWHQSGPNPGDNNNNNNNNHNSGGKHRSPRARPPHSKCQFQQPKEKRRVYRRDHRLLVNEKLWWANFKRGRLKYRHQKRLFYTLQLQNATSNRPRCRRYVNGALYNDLLNSSFIIDDNDDDDDDDDEEDHGDEMMKNNGGNNHDPHQRPPKNAINNHHRHRSNPHHNPLYWDIQQDGPLDLRTWVMGQHPIDTTISEHRRCRRRRRQQWPYTMSRISVRQVNVQDHRPLLSNCNNVGECHAKIHTSPCRKDSSDIGKMFGTGHHVLINGECKEFAKPKHFDHDLVRKLCQQASTYLEQEFPQEVETMRSTERAFGLYPSYNMGGPQGLTASMDQSVDLGNSSHFDILDSSPGVSIWTELDENRAGHWFFVLPNLQVCHNGETYYGVVIRLHHGTAISWDGRIIRHCTSVTDVNGCQPVVTYNHRRSNHVFGTFWAAKVKVIANRLRKGMLFMTQKKDD